MSDTSLSLNNGVINFKKQVFEGVCITEDRRDLAFMGANSQYLAIVPANDANSFHVWTIDPAQNKISGGLKHKLESACLSIDFDPFYGTRVITSCDNGKFYQWHLDMDLTTESAKPVVMYEPSSSTAIQTLYHTSAGNVAFLVNAKCITIVNLLDATIIRRMDFDRDCQSASLNHDSTEIVCVFADNLAIVYKTSDFSPIYCAKLANSRRACQVVYLSGIEGGFFAVSSLVNGKRALHIYKIVRGQYTEKNPANATHDQFELEGTSKRWNMIYDQDTNLLVLATGGESAVSYVYFGAGGEIKGRFTKYAGSSSTSISKIIGGPKLSINPAEKDLIKLYVALKSTVEVYCLGHLRKGDGYEKDLYPPTNSPEPAMSVEEFIAGKVCPPNKIDMQSIFSECKKGAGVNRSYSTMSSSSDRLATSPLPMQNTYGGGVSSSEFEDLKNQVAALSARVDELSLKLEKQ